MYMSLCLLLTLSAVESDDKFKINETIYTENGTASVDLSCGEVPQSALATEWFIKESDGWNKLLKFHHTNSEISIKFYNYTNYDISESVNTSLVVKNVQLSDSTLFMCGAAGGSNKSYERITMLQVVGKSPLTNLFISSNLVIIKMHNLLKFKEIFRICL